MLRVVITDLLVGECELTGKTDAECVRVQFDEDSPEALIATTEFFRLLRFERKQREKREKSKPTDSQTLKGAKA